MLKYSTNVSGVTVLYSKGNVPLFWVPIMRVNLFYTDCVLISWCCVVRHIHTILLTVKRGVRETHQSTRSESGTSVGIGGGLSRIVGHWLVERAVVVHVVSLLARAHEWTPSTHVQLSDVWLHWHSFRRVCRWTRSCTNTDNVERKWDYMTCIHAVSTTTWCNFNRPVTQ